MCYTRTLGLLAHVVKQFVMAVSIQNASTSSVHTTCIPVMEVYRKVRGPTLPAMLVNCQNILVLSITLKHVFKNLAKCVNYSAPVKELPSLGHKEHKSFVNREWINKYNVYF